MTLRVGLGTFSGQIAAGGSPGEAYREVADLCVLAEEEGLDSVWVSEHHATDNSHIPAPLLLLSAVAARTRRIRLGTGISIGPLQHPLRFAEDCAVLDRLSRGRLTVGIGAGWRPEEFRLFGVPFAERGTRTEELVTICRSAWTARPFDHQGKHFSFHDAVVTPAPAAEIPIYMVGRTRRALARAAKLGNGYFADGVPQSGPDALAARVGQLDDLIRAEGRDPGSVPVCFAVNVWVTDGSVPDSVHRAMWARIAASLNWHAGRPENTPLPIDIEETERRGWLGTPESIVRRARSWLEPLATHDLELILRVRFPGIPSHQSAAQIRLIAEFVVPELRSLRLGTR